MPMPSSHEALQGLAGLAHAWTGMAIAWHAAGAAILLACAAGYRPGLRLILAALIAPLLSVSLLALAGQNPFNAVAFALLAAGLTGSALAAGAGELRTRPRFLLLAGAASFLTAWVYPHFLGDDTGWRYFYLAPLGVLPCPTLLAAVGLSLLVEGALPRAGALLLAAFGLFYGLLGVLWLGVALDAVLVAGSALLGAVALWPRRSRALSHHVAVRTAHLPASKPTWRA
jgi:hypothetical protein